MQNTSEQRKDEVCLHVDLFKKKNQNKPVLNLQHNNCCRKGVTKRFAYHLRSL